MKIKDFLLMLNTLENIRVLCGDQHSCTLPQPEYQGEMSGLKDTFLLDKKIKRISSAILEIDGRIESFITIIY